MNRWRAITVFSAMAAALLTSVYMHFQHRVLLDDLRTTKALFLPKPSDTVLQMNATTPADVSFQMPAIERIAHVKTADDAQSRRRRLKTYLFGATGDPAIDARLASETVGSCMFPLNVEFPGNIQRLTFRMSEGIESTVSYWKGKKDGRLLLFYLDSETADAPTLRLINEAFKREDSVAIFFMPFKGPNPQPTATLEKSKIKLREWNWLSLLKPRSGHSEKFFAQPVPLFLNRVEKNGAPRSVSLIGQGSGSWPALLCAAIDPRITSTICLCGPYPFFISTFARNLIAPLEFPFGSRTLHEIAGQVDQYAMAASGRGRSLLVCFRKTDVPFLTAADNNTLKTSVNDILKKIDAGSFTSVLEDGAVAISGDTEKAINAAVGL